MSAYTLHRTTVRRKPDMRGLRHALASILLASVAFFISGGASRAADYPERPVQLVIPFPPGGSIDFLGRLLPLELSARLGQPFVVENKAGAGTAIAAQHVARAKPDGHTLLLSSNSTYTLNPALVSKPGYDPVDAFEPVAMVANVPLVLVVNSQVAAATLGDFLSMAKAESGRYAYGSFGNGTAAHFAGEMLASTTQTPLLHVPYRGSAMAMTDLIGGQIPAAIDSVVAAAPHIRSGKIRPIAVTTAKRSALLPGVPTVAESGYPEFDLGAWIALVGPRGLSANAKHKLVQALQDVMGKTEVREQLVAAGFDPGFAVIPRWDKLVGGEILRLRRVVEHASIQPNQ